MDAQLKKGILEIAVLASLAKEPSYGYKIISDLDPYLEISESTLYPILKRLEFNGLVKTFTKEFNGRLRKYYEINSEGQIRLREYSKDLDELIQIYHFVVERSKGRK